VVLTIWKNDGLRQLGWIGWIIPYISIYYGTYMFETTNQVISGWWFISP
jgi:hypothetical protein